MKNNYEVINDYVQIEVVYKEQIYYVRIDKEDLELVSSIRGSWWLKHRKHTNYCWAQINGKNILMHRFLLNPDPALSVDHIDHDGMNNRRSNMRVVTQFENMQNRKSANQNNKCGGLNVHWDKVKKKWKVAIRINGKEHYVGRFSKLDEAKVRATEARQFLLNPDDAPSQR